MLRRVLILVIIFLPIGLFTPVQAGHWDKKTKDATVSMNWTGSKSLIFTASNADKMNLNLEGGFQFSFTSEVWTNVHLGIKINNYTSVSNSDDQVIGSISRTHISLPVYLKTDWLLALDDKLAFRGIGGADFNFFGAGVNHTLGDVKINDGRIWEFPVSIGLEVRPKAFPIHFSMTYTRVMFMSSSDGNADQYTFTSAGNDYLYFGFGISVNR